jgi:hypothetical protein
MRITVISCLIGEYIKMNQASIWIMILEGACKRILQGGCKSILNSEHDLTE